MNFWIIAVIAANLVTGLVNVIMTIRATRARRRWLTAAEALERTTTDALERGLGGIVRL